MADTFGLLELPAPVAADDPGLGGTPVPAGDPCLAPLLAFSQAVLNAEVNAAWIQRAPSPGNAETVARYTFALNPTETLFDERRVPALYLFRAGGGTFDQEAEELFFDRERLTLQWIFPPAQTLDVQRKRATIVNALSKALAMAINAGRHPAYVVAADLADTDAIKTSIATSTILATYSGAALNGVVGAGVVHAPRPVSITSSAAAGAYNITDPIVVTGLLAGDVEHEESIYLTAANGAQTVTGIWNFKSVSSIAVPAQSLTTGAFLFGYAASPEVEYGSLIKRQAGLTELKIASGGTPKPLVIDILDDGGNVERRETYSMVEFQIDIVEQFVEDIAGGYTSLLDAPSGNGANLTFTYGNGDNDVYMTAQLPNT